MGHGSLSRAPHTKTQSEDKHVESRLVPCLDRGSTPRISTLPAGARGKGLGHTSSPRPLLFRTSHTPAQSLPPFSLQIKGSYRTLPFTYIPMGETRKRQGVPHSALTQSVDFLNYIRKSGGKSYVPRRCWCRVDYSDICGEKQGGYLPQSALPSAYARYIVPFVSKG